MQDAVHLPQAQPLGLDAVGQRLAGQGASRAMKMSNP